MRNDRIIKFHIEINKKNWKTIPDTIEDKVFMKAFWDLNKLKLKCKKSEIRIHKSFDFTSQYNKSEYKPMIDKLISDLYNGLLYSDSNKSDYTTYLIKESNNTSLVYEKRITSRLTNDRLIYSINKPYIESNVLIIPVILLSCLHHDRPSQRMNSEDDSDFWAIKRIDEMPW